MLQSYKKVKHFVCECNSTHPTNKSKFKNI